MPDVPEVLIGSLTVTGAWVLAVLSIRVRRLERVPRSPLSAQIGRLQDKVRKLQADHEVYAQRQGRRLRELDATTARLEGDLRAVAAQVERLPDAVVEGLRRQEKRPSSYPRGSLGSGRHPFMSEGPDDTTQWVPESA